MRFGYIVSGLLLTASLPVFAGTALTLGSAAGYNVFVFGAYATPGGTDIQGAVAVGGNFTSTGSLSINEVPGSATQPTTPAFVVGGNLSLSGGQVDNGNAGDAWVAGNVSSSGYFNFQHGLSYGNTLTTSNIVTGTTPVKVNPTTIPISFSSAATSLTQLSNTLEGMTANGSVSMSGPNVNLTATGCTLCVFDLPGGNFSGGAITISAPAGATVLINVSGSASLSNGSLNYAGGASASMTLFNFNTATSVTTSGFTLYGSVLAPLATFTATNGSLDGELIAAAVSGETGEFESGDIFKGNLGSTTTATPEPSTIQLVAGGLILVGVGRRKKSI